MYTCLETQTVTTAQRVISGLFDLLKDLYNYHPKMRLYILTGRNQIEKEVNSVTYCGYEFLLNDLYPSSINIYYFV